MRVPHFKRNSLLWRILLSTSVAVSVVFALTGWMIQRYATAVSEHSVEEEIRTSLQAYQSLWAAKVHNFTEISRIMSSMSDVRAAFMTGDQATIRDTAEQLWSKVSDEGASFLVLDPTGKVITSLGGRGQFTADPTYIASALHCFPKQVSGYAARGTRLYFVVLTPVYVQAQNEQGLLNILLIAFDIDKTLANELKTSTHGSDFVFLSADKVIASTLPLIHADELRSAAAGQGHTQKVALLGEDRLVLSTDLTDTAKNAVGQLFVIRSFARPQATLASLRRTVAIFWTAGIIVALALTYVLSRRILEPVRTLDLAAEQVTKRNYDYRVPVETDDELGRLAKTFNEMCESIRRARDDLIRQEQISTISRLSSSIVHDLRNPLAAIYGGAEMLVDTQLSPDQQRRLAVNIYSSSRRMQELLQELLDVSRPHAKPLEVCRLSEIVEAARDEIGRTAQLQGVTIHTDIASHIQVMVSSARLERVFINLIGNAIDAMPDGGQVRISARVEDTNVLVFVDDSGRGILQEAWPNLFRPFATYGKRNGLGLGLALSRQVLLDSGGDLWVEKKDTPGARFVMRLPASGEPLEYKPQREVADVERTRSK